MKRKRGNAKSKSSKLPMVCSDVAALNRSCPYGKVQSGFGDFDYANFDSGMVTETPRAEANVTDWQPYVGQQGAANGKLEFCSDSLRKMIISIVRDLSEETGGVKTKPSRDFGISSDSQNSNASVFQPHGERIRKENSKALRQDRQNQGQELKAALLVIKKIMKMDAAELFSIPVDPIALGIPDYFDVIDTPMDFGTICNNLEKGIKYMNSEEVYKDVQYIWENCCTYNKKGDCILELMDGVRKIFSVYWTAAGLYTKSTEGDDESSMRCSIRRQGFPVDPVTDKVGPSAVHPYIPESLFKQPQLSTSHQQPSLLHQHMDAGTTGYSNLPPPSESPVRRSTRRQGWPVDPVTDKVSLSAVHPCTPASLLKQPQFSSSQHQPSLLRQDRNAGTTDCTLPPPEVNMVEPHLSGNQSGRRSESASTVRATARAQEMEKGRARVSAKKRSSSNVNRQQDMDCTLQLPEVNMVEPHLSGNHSVRRSESVSTILATPQAQGRARASYRVRSSSNTDQQRDMDSTSHPPVVNMAEPYLSGTHSGSRSESAKVEGAMTQVQDSQPKTSTHQRKNTRGPTSGVREPKPGQKKVKVNVLMNTLVPIQARSKICPVIKKHFTKLITSWNKFEKKDVDKMWGEYLKYFRFSSRREEARGRSVWEKIARTNYPKYLYNWKKAAVKKYGSVVAARSHHEPGWTSLEVWQKLCDYWLSDDFQKASALRTANLASKKRIPHTSGRYTYEERSIEQFNDLGREPTQYEVFAYNHMTVKDDGTKVWVTEEAAQLLDDYQNRLREKNGLPPDARVNEVKDPGLEIWQETVGGVSKGKLIGRPGEKWSKRGVSTDHQAYVESQESMEKWKRMEKDNKKKAKREAKLYNFITNQNTYIKDQSALLASMTQYVQVLAQKCGMESPPSMSLRPPPTPPFTSSTDDEDDDGVSGDAASHGLDGDPSSSHENDESPDKYNTDDEST